MSWLFRSLVVLLGLGVLSGGAGCGGGRCEGEIGPTRADPNGRSCSSLCQCNNQLYSGICKEGKCISSARESCTLSRQRRSCKLPSHAVIGSCKEGTQVCRAQGLEDLVWGDCKLQAYEEKEGTFSLCTDGLDNDCDGKVDAEDDECQGFCRPGDERPCYTGPAQTRGKGPCKDGKQQCTNAGDWGKCEGEVQGSPETCNGKDDDCDGVADNGLTGCSRCKQGEKRPCYLGTVGCKQEAGAWSCVGACRTGFQLCNAESFWGKCESEVGPAKEDCDGLDNDCDGSVDEADGKPSLEQPCYPSSRGCSRDDKGNFVCEGGCRAGTQRCQGGSWGSCTGSVQPNIEGCNGKDDDCNGKIDEDIEERFCYDGPTGTVGLGICQAGKQSCQNGRWGTCVGEVRPKQETCNGQDDDCDGQTDEDAGCD